MLHQKYTIQKKVKEHHRKHHNLEKEKIKKNGKKMAYLRKKDTVFRVPGPSRRKCCSGRQRSTKNGLQSKRLKRFCSESNCVTSSAKHSRPAASS